MIDRINIRSGINKIANQVFITEDLTKDDIDIFVNEIIKFVTSEFDAYISQNEQDLISFIPEQNKAAFKDFTNGYVRKMQEWMEENPVNVNLIEVPLEQVADSMPNRDAVKKALTIAGVGTIITIGISFFTPALVAIIAEFVALCIAYKVYKKKNNYSEANNIRKSIDEIKEEMIKYVNNDINSWLDKADEWSDQLFKSYRYEMVDNGKITLIESIKM